MIFNNANILTNEWKFVNCDLRVSEGRIVEIGSLVPDTNEEIIECDGKYLIPGLVETHFHGAMGEDSDALTDKTFDTFSRFFATQGITTFVPGLSSNKDETVEDFLIKSSVYMREKPKGSKMGGVYLEGPFISYARRGGHSPEMLQLPSCEKLKKWYGISGGTIKKTIVAPELNGAEEFIRAGVEYGITMEIGHTTATYEQALKAIDLGASLATHTFNGMEPLNHRNPGVLGAVLTDDRVTCELIADFGHVSAPIVKLVILAKGDDKVNIISDSMIAAGWGDGIYNHWDGRVLNVKNGLSYTEEGTITGSASTIMDGVRNLVSIGIPLESAVKMASHNPACTIGLKSKIGSIALNKCADLVLLDKDLNISGIWIDGESISLQM